MQETGNDIEHVMPQPDVAVTDETINFNRSDDYTLLIQLSLDNCIYSLLDTERNTLVSLHNFSSYHLHPVDKVFERISTVINEGPIISVNNYSDVFVSIVNNNSTIVPEAILEHGKEEKFLAFNHTSQGDEIYSDKMNAIDAVNIYSVSSRTEEIIRGKFPGASYRHFSTQLIENLIIKNKHQEDKQVTLHVQASHFEVIVTQGKSLLFYNSFNYKAPEDILYFLLNVFEQLQLNPEITHLHLIGEIEKRSGIYNLLNKYIRYINFGSRPERVNFSYGFHDIPEHYYYSLFSLASCV
jgi:hypothetical protein